MKAKGGRGRWPAALRGRVPLAIVCLAPFILTGCSNWSDARSVQAGGYTILLKTDPSPAEVGRTASVSLGIRDDRDRTVRACNVSFRQYMPEHEMSTDDVIVQMKEQRSGVYTGESPEYSMGGDWRIEATFDCGTGIHQAKFDFTLAWPE